MKAKFVNENIEFTRNSDPKNTIGIGSRPVLKEKYLFVLDKLDYRPYSSLTHDFSSNIQKILLRFPDRLRSKMGWGNVCAHLDLLSDEQIGKIRRVVKIYFDKIKEIDES